MLYSFENNEKNLFTLKSFSECTNVFSASKKERKKETQVSVVSAQQVYIFVDENSQSR